MNEPFLKPGTPGYTTTVLTRWGRETYQVWLDNAPIGWMARIVTLPNRIWAQQGGREAIKFYGATREEAESAAASYIEEECVRTNRRVESVTTNEFAASRTAPDDSMRLSPPPSRQTARAARRLLVRFGKDIMSRAGVTANLSETGMFIVTDRPEPPGTPVRLDVRFPQGPLPLEGMVVWNRLQKEEGRSIGFGVQITERPVEYVLRIREMQPAEVIF